MKFAHESNVDAYRAAFLPMFLIQVVLMMFIGTGSVTAGISQEYEDGMVDYHRLTPMTPMAKIVGYLFGLPIREWFLFAVTSVFIGIIVKDVAGSASEVIKDEEEFGGIWTNSLGYTYTFDNRRTGLNPNAGVVLRFGQEFGFGDAQFVKTTALVGAETKVFNEDVTLRATYEGGLLKQRV